MKASPLIVYGVGCFWWDSISKANGQTRNGSLCCPDPACHGLLFQMESKDWWRQVDEHERAGNPGYRAFVEWWQGRHFKTFEAARAAYDVYKIDNGGMGR